MKKRVFLFILVLILAAHFSYSDINRQENYKNLTEQKRKPDEAIAGYKKTIEINSANATAQ